MKKKVTISTKTLVVIIIIAIALISAFFVLSGNTALFGWTTITGPEQASDTITDISANIQDLERALTDIDQSLG